MHPDIINQIRNEYEYLQNKDNMDTVINEIININHFHETYDRQPIPISVHTITFTNNNNFSKIFRYACRYSIDTYGNINIIQRGIFNDSNDNRYDM